MALSNATGSAIAPKVSGQLRSEIHKLQIEKERLMAYLAFSLSHLKHGIMDVGKALQTNAKLGQDNVFLRHAIAKEMGGQWPSSWSDPADEYFDDAGNSLDDEWSSRFEALSSNAEQHVFTSNGHGGLPKILEEINNTCFEWPSLLPNGGTIACAEHPRSPPSWFNVSDDAPPLGSFSLCGDCQFVPPQSVQMLGDPQTEPAASLEAEAGETMRKQSEELADTSAGENTGEPFGELDSAQNPGVNFGSEGSVPHEQSFPEVSSKPPRALPPGVTTLVVRNIPGRLTPEKLLEVWPVDGSYNLLHVPFSFQKQRRSGIAFINMVSHQAAVEFAAKWHGRKLASIGGIKRLDVGVAEVQGFEGNLRHLKGSKIKNDSFLPLAFNGTQRLDVKSLLEGHGVRGDEQGAPLPDERFGDARSMAQQASSSSQDSNAWQ